MRGGGAGELVPAVAAGVAGQLEVGHGVGHAALPEQWQPAHVAGGGEGKRQREPPRVGQRRVGHHERALELAVEQEGGGGQAPAQPLRIGLGQHAPAVPGPLGQLDRVVGRLAGGGRVQGGLSQEQALALGARTLDRVLDDPGRALERERLEVGNDRGGRDEAGLELVAQLELLRVARAPPAAPDRALS